ncbi:MAG TPA: hypothetical protein VHQ92_13855 [Pseudolabrys sp.]|jgi:hypothetical protein|nr:hypothetical protein [Pseudolabrys sp.]
MSDVVAEQKVVRTMKAVKARERHCWQERAETDAGNGEAVRSTHLATPARGRRPASAISVPVGTRPENVSRILKDVSATQEVRPEELGVRAENVLKELAVELTGESPPKGRWTPSDKMLRKLTFNHLLTARNCGPQTTEEIARWAGLRGVVIRPPFYAGKSLSAMWRDLIAKFSSGEFTKAEITEALERSARRKNTRIPVAFQTVLLNLLNSTGE